MRAAMLLASVLLVAPVGAARAQSGGNRAGFSGRAFSGRSGGYQPGFGNFGYLGGFLPQAGAGAYRKGRGTDYGARASGPNGYQSNWGAEPSGRTDDGVRIGGTGGSDLGHGIHFGDGECRQLALWSGRWQCRRRLCQPGLRQ